MPPLKVIIRAILPALILPAFALAQNFPLNYRATVAGTAAVSGAGNNITQVNLTVYPPGGGSQSYSRTANTQNYAFSIPDIPLTQYAPAANPYRFVLTSTATGPGGTTTSAPYTITATTYNPSQTQTIVTQYIPGANAPSSGGTSWVANGGATTSTFTVYQYNIPASFTGPNPRYVGQVSTVTVPTNMVQIENARSGTFQAKITATGPTKSQTTTKAVTGGNWTYTFTNL